VARRSLGFWRRLAVVLVKPLMILLSRTDWRGMSNIPKSGPVIIVANHISHADPFALAHYVYDAGRWPQYLAKASIFRIPVLGPIVGWVSQIPVERGTVDARKALDAAVEAVQGGGCVLIYPEGTTTKEPDLWPMRGKTGAARLWLLTQAPVIPVVMWGPERLFDPRTRKLHPRIKTPITVIAGEPLDLSRWDGASATAGTLADITEFFMLTLRDMLVDIRGGTAPPLWSRPAPASADGASGDGAASDDDAAAFDASTGESGRGASGPAEAEG
jgi:1-acyl-sn-glycerol-3-phosphate acyltransferase